MLDEEQHPVSLAIDLALNVASVWEGVVHVVESSQDGNLRLAALTDIFGPYVCQSTEAAIYLLARVYLNAGVAPARMQNALPEVMADIITRATVAG